MKDISKYGYREGQNDSIHWLPEMVKGERYFVIKFGSVDGYFNDLMKIANQSRLMNVDKIVEQQGPVVVSKGWGVKEGNLSIVFEKIPVSESDLYVYLQNPEQIAQ